MASALSRIMNIPQTAIGKGTVGAPPPPPEGKEGVQFKVALFFDGTMNNRANTKVRLNRNEQIKDGSKKDLILDDKKKNMLSSYANYYSNVSILELLNLQRLPKNYEVSVYVEGIGTVNYEEGVTRKNKHGEDATNLFGKKKKIPTKVADISNDQQGGYAFGTGFTGIVDRVTQGIRNAKVAIRKAYDPEGQYIEKITIDVIGFSRGAAAARHFVSRYEGFRGIWPPQSSPPELVVNFVGLFETVSSYEENNSLLANGVKSGLFSKNVGELQLALGGLPKRVVHLTAQDEIRHNFSLTTIDSSLQVGGNKAFQVSLPGVHSDVGGGYVEPDPDNPQMDPTKTYPNDPGRPAIRGLNQENRRILNRKEKLQLLAEGWYTDGTNGTLDQLEPVDGDEYARHRTWEDHRANLAQAKGQSYQRAPYTGEEYGTRYLTNEYQYVSLYLMRCMAKNELKPGAHTPMRFQELRGEDGVYEVPPDLVAIRDHFKTRMEEFADGKPDNELAFETDEQAKKIRNKYLHRSSRIAKDITGYDSFTTWVAYKRAEDGIRVVYSDTGDSAEGQPVKVPDLGKEAPTGASTATTTGAAGAGEVPAGSGLGEVNDPVEMEQVPAVEGTPRETGTSELNDQ